MCRTVEAEHLKDRAKTVSGPPVASENAEQTWACNDAQVAFEFTPGVVIYEGPKDLADPAATYAALAKAYPEFSVGDIEGVVVQSLRSC